MRTIETAIRQTARPLLAALGLWLAPAALGQAADQVPPAFEGVGIVDRRGEAVPPDLVFTDETGRQVRLGTYFESGVPVILTLNYYRCPMLCSLILNGLVDGLNDLDLDPGKDFIMLTVSFNPEEGTELASVKKKAYLTQYKREGAAESWYFLTGTADNIKALTDAVGYGYRYDEASGEYAHPSTIIFLMPDGRISLYMDDTVFDARDLRLALVEASKGSVGSPLDQIALFMCFQYDPESNSYKVVAWKIMRTGGMLTLMVLVTGLAILWGRDLRRRASERNVLEPGLAGGVEG